MSNEPTNAGEPSPEEGWLADVVPCPMCGDRWCELCREHWADCSCPGPDDEGEG